ncbi:MULTISPECIES: outer membrane protein assembly factor BamB family protein [Halomicrobium]|uniref:Pyrrolo-quinoline quinone n=2 Tax=Halomicrobium mukohataei TaxID=57705 RepID=C7NZ28_HALMD|nr:MULTISPECIES: PQQ-binding-like beta-propeller repeat protein [Halomicrobium]ACV46714.1 Pyrrolo-quinoline quinone [Halomicrobium mukohataei DSM 12286]QCD65223.1 pyrrolo-quinoline quinone [Halomicrobium mukohataei]QFR20029.1 PQQ-binding-like beta-propeller repeat protein [Halomicrobium sp. ZPS1]
MDRRTFLTTTCAGTAALSGCLSSLPWTSGGNTPLPEVPGGSWTQHGADAANTFAPDVAAPSRASHAWTSAAFTRWDPVIADGTIYTTNFDPSHDGSAIALDAQDGTERWRTTLDREGRHGRALVDGRFVVAHDSGLVALDRQGGGVDWERSVEGLETSFAELLAVDRSTGTIVVPYADGLKAFGATDGQRRWKAPELPGQRVTPAIADGTVYAVGSVDGAATLAALALADGSVRWTRSLDGRSPSAPVVTDRGVLVVDDRTLVVHDRETGDRRGERHSFDYDGTTFDATVATDGTTAFVTSDDGLTAVDIADGTTRWEYDEWVYTAGCSVGTETVVAMADRGEYTDRTITAFDRETGEARWDYVMDDFHTPSIPPILADGAVFFATSSSDGLVAIGDVPE